jgi:hypothetical protein
MTILDEADEQPLRCWQTIIALPLEKLSVKTDYSLLTSRYKYAKILKAGQLPSLNFSDYASGGGGGGLLLSK